MLCFSYSPFPTIIMDQQRSEGRPMEPAIYLRWLIRIHLRETNRYKAIADNFVITKARASRRQNCSLARFLKSNAGLNFKVPGIQIRTRSKGVFELKNLVFCLESKLHDMLMLGSEVETVSILSLLRPKMMAARSALWLLFRIPGAFPA